MCNWAQLPSNSASGQGTNDPLQVQSLEGNQDQTGGVTQIYSTFWVHDMVRRFGSDVLLEAFGGRLVHPAGKTMRSFDRETRICLNTFQTSVEGLEHLGFRLFQWVQSPLTETYDFKLKYGRNSLKLNTH